MISSLGLSLILGELALRAVYHPRTITIGWRGLNLPAEETNALGFRGRPIDYAPDDFVVILLGDSQVECRACPFESMPEGRLEGHLRSSHPEVRVFTLGASGYGQDQQLLVLEEYFEQHRADLVLLWQTPRNDVWNNMFPTHWPANGAPKPTFLLKNGGLVGPNLPMGQSVAFSRLRLLALVQQARFRPPTDEQWERKLPPAYEPMSEYSGEVDHEWDEWLASDRERMKDENLENEKSHLALELYPRSPRTVYGIELTRRLTARIDSVSRANGASLILFTALSPDELVRPRDAVRILNGRYYRTSRTQTQTNLEALREGFHWYSIRVTEDEWRVSRDDPHLNEVAVDQVMRDLAEELRSVVRSGQAR